MSLPTDGHREVLDLTWKLIGGEIDAAESQRLDELVATDARQRRLYLNALDLVAGLEWGEQVSHVRSWHADFPLGKAPKPRHDRAVSWIARGKSVWRRQSMLARVASIGFAAMVFYGTFTILAWNLRPLDPPNRDDAAVAIVRETVDARWSPTTEAKTNDTPINRGERLTLNAGIVEVELKGGAKIVVEGPAEWAIEGDNKTTLHTGKLMAIVPPKAIGFTLDTPTAKIVDLGTEFGVEVGANGSTNLHVLTGRVDVAQTSVTKSKQVPVRVEQGEAILIDRERGVSAVTSAAPQRFVELSLKRGKEERRVLLLRDNFRTLRSSKASADVRLNVDLAERQEGAAAPVKFLSADNDSSVTQVDRYDTPDYLAPERLMLFPHAQQNPFVWTTLDLCFPADIELSAKCDPVVNDIKSTDWLAIGLRGHSSEMSSSNPLEAKTGGVMFGLRSNGGWFVTVNGQSVREAQADEFLASTVEGFKVRLRVEGRLFSAWVNQMPLDLNGLKEGTALELTGEAAGYKNFISLSATATESIPSAFDGHEGHKIGKFEIYEIRQR